MEKSALFKLIKRLTKGEVRCIREELLPTGKESQVLQLFDYLRTSTSRRITKRKIHQKLGVSYVQIPKLKYRLKRKVIVALLEKNKLEITDSAPELSFAKILWEKGLAEDAKAVTTRAKEKAINKENFGDWMQLIELEQEMGMVKDLSSLEEEKEMLELYQNWVSFKSLRSRLVGAFADLSTTPPKISLLEQVRNDPLLADVSNAKSKKAYFEFHKIHADLDYMYGNEEIGIKKSQMLIDYLDKNPYLFPGDDFMHLEEYGKIAIASYTTNRWDLFKESIHSLHCFPCKNHSGVAIKFDKLVGSLLALSIDLGDLEVGKWVTAVVERHYSKFEVYIEPSRFQLIQYYQARSYFIQGEFGAAYRWCGKVTNIERKNQNVDTFLFSRLLGLILLYETEEFDALEYHLTSLNNYINSLPLRYDLPKLMVKAFKRLRNHKPDSDQTLIQYWNQAHDLKQDKNQIWAFNMLDFELWLDCKIHKKPLSSRKQEDWKRESMREVRYQLPTLDAQVFKIG